MHGVGNGDEVEEVAARVGAEEDVLGSKLIPGDPLTGEEEGSEEEGRRQPNRRAVGDRTSEAEPFVHGVDLAEHGLAGDLGGDGAEDESDGVEPEDGGDGGGEPFVDEAVVGIEVAAGLGDEEDTDEGDEEHEIAAEGEEEADAGLGKTLMGAAMTAGSIVPVIAIAFTVAAGALVGRRAVSVIAIADAVAIYLRRCDGRRHGLDDPTGYLCQTTLLCFGVKCVGGTPLRQKLFTGITVMAGAAVDDGRLMLWMQIEGIR